VAAAAKAAGPSVSPPILQIPDVVVVADVEMLRAVLLNLLLNACQAAGADLVQVIASVRDGRCQVSILDRGPGIPPDVRDKVFEPFFTTKRGGTGLGLAIVKRLVDLQGGAVRLGDREGGGSIATVELPVSGEVPARSSVRRDPD
jgi:signal transduction histidine kinase